MEYLARHHLSNRPCRFDVVAIDEAVGPTLKNFQLLVEPSFQQIPPGGTATFTVKVVGLFGFEALVSLSALELPNGVTAAFSVNPVMITPLARATTSLLTVTAGPGAGTSSTSGFVIMPQNAA